MDDVAIGGHGGPVDVPLPTGQQPRLAAPDRPGPQFENAVGVRGGIVDLGPVTGEGHAAVRLLVLHPLHRGVPARIAKVLHTPVPLNAGDPAARRHHGKGEAAAFSHHLAEFAGGPDTPDARGVRAADDPDQRFPIGCPGELQQVRAGRENRGIAPSPQRPLGPGPNVVDKPPPAAAIEGAFVHEEPVAVRMPHGIADLAGGQAQDTHFSSGEVVQEQLPPLGVGELAAIRRDTARRVAVPHRTHLVRRGEVDGVRAGVAGGGPGSGGSRDQGGGE